MPTDAVEIERRYEVEGDVPLPDFAELPGVVAVTQAEHHLEAEYFDTPELDLARAGVTLRRRTGGEDAGWQLKVPFAGDRVEIREPMAEQDRSDPVRESVPGRLRTLVVALTGSRPVSLVATVRTRRTVRRLVDNDGRVIAEVADDRVTGSDSRRATTRTWREWEVELVEGPSSALEDIGRLLVDRGAGPSPWPSKLARALDLEDLAVQPHAADDGSKDGPAGTIVQARLAEQVDQLRLTDPLVRLDAPGALHDFRVAIRRLRAALASYRPLLADTVTGSVRAELKWLGNEMSPARDAQVLRARLQSMLSNTPPVHAAEEARGRVDTALRQEEHHTRAHALHAMETTRYIELLDRLNAFIASPPFTEHAARPVDDVLRERLAHDWERLNRRVARAEAATDADERAPALHEVRKAAKRVRYAAEPLIPVYGKDAKRLAKATKHIQSVLGDHHDSVVARQRLQGLAVQVAAEGGNTFLLGVLYAREEATAAQLEAKYEKTWRHATRKRTLKLISWPAVSG